MIQLQNLKKTYRTTDIETTALNNISLDIKEGEFVSIMGPSGCGKTTLLNVLGILDTPNEGSYRLLGKDVFSLGKKAQAELRKKHIGFVFQNFNLIDELTVYENIELPLLYQKWKSSDRQARVKKVMEDMNIAHRGGHYPQQLSGGQQQRVAVARALVNEPKIILADEPTGNLDSKNGREVMELLSELNDKGTTIIMVTHSIQDARYSQRIVNLLDGNILSESANQLVATKTS